MAEREVYIGSVGPFLYDDTETYGDGEYQEGLRTGGCIRVEGEPTEDYHVTTVYYVKSSVRNALGYKRIFLLGGGM